MTRVLLILLLLATATGITACGNKGPLFLPEPSEGKAGAGASAGG